MSPPSFRAAARRRQRRYASRKFDSLERRDMLSVNVLMYHNDPASTGQNLSETVLTPQNVNAGQFGKLFTTPVDGQVYAQPLYVSNVNITSGPHPGIHNVAVVATEHDSLYAIDASSGEVLWHDSFIDPAAGITAIPHTDLSTNDISPEVGITSTPVIDSATGTIYVEARTKEVIGGQSHYMHKLHAVSIESGAEVLGEPLVLGDTILNADGSYAFVSGPATPGTGDGSTGGIVHFNAVREHQRTALSLVNGVIYLGFASLSDVNPYHGWILGVDAQSMKLVAALNTSPNGAQAGIWQSGGGISSDAQGNLYVATGNGTVDTTLNANGFPINGDYGDSILKIAVDPNSSPTHQNINGWGLKVVDYFTPFNQQALSQADQDLGSGGVLVLPDSAGSAAHPHLLVVAGKEGVIYLLDRDHMGGYDPLTDHVLQEFNGLYGGSYDVPAYFNGMVYYAGRADPVKSFSVSGGSMSVLPTSVSPEKFHWPGAGLSISAHGANSANGIVWALVTGTKNANQLLAFDAANLSDQLYSSAGVPAGRDALGTGVKFSVPTVANGRVYAGTATALVGYGLLPAGAVSPPSNGSLASLSGFEGSPVGGAVLATFSAGSGLEPSSDFQATVNWGDGSISSAEVVAAGGAYQVQASHVYGDEGTWQLTVAISNPGGSIQLTGQAHIAERLLPDGTRGTADDRFLSELYDNLLGRPIDMVGWTYWSGVLNDSQSRATVVQMLESTGEFRHVEVQRLFQHYLGRAADPAALEFFSQKLAAGATQEEIAERLLASHEYFSQRGNGVASGFLNAVYRDVLGRAIDDAARNHWEQALDSGMSRGEFVHLVFSSAEYQSHVVGTLYEELLDRVADPTGSAAFSGWLAAGGRQEQVSAALAASDEFFAKTAG